MARIAVIGDLHEHWNAQDNAYFNRSDYDLLLFVGDLTSILSLKRTPTIARRLAEVRKRALMIAGNHEVHNLIQLAAEVFDNQRLMWLSGARHADFYKHLARWIAPVELGGYSSHFFRFGDVAFDVIVARPCSMGSGLGPGVSQNGPHSDGNTRFRKRLNFVRLLREVYGVDSLATSAQRLKACVDGARSERLIFLAHNGPTGLGDAPDDLWGRDFGEPVGGDWGDEDLRVAIDYALEKGKKVEAVVAGHMHLRTKQGEERPWLKRMDGVAYVNAARVPRARRAGRHHVSIGLDGVGVEVEERFV